MALIGRLAEPFQRDRQVHRDSATELVGLAEVELRIRIAADRERAPFGDGTRIVALIPGIHTGFDVGKCGGRAQQAYGDRAGQKGSHVHTPRRMLKIDRLLVRSWLTSS
jgi:hypothetical protein